MMTELGQRVMLITLTFIQSYRTKQILCRRSALFKYKQPGCRRSFGTANHVYVYILYINHSPNKWNSVCKSLKIPPCPCIPLSGPLPTGTSDGNVLPFQYESSGTMFKPRLKTPAESQDETVHRKILAKVQQLSQAGLGETSFGLPVTISLNPFVS